MTRPNQCGSNPNSIQPKPNATIKGGDAGDVPGKRGASCAKPPTAIEAAEIALSQFAVSLMRSLWISDMTIASGRAILADRPARSDYEFLSQLSVRFGQPVFFST